MEIGELCSREVYLVRRNEPLVDAVREMHRRHVGCVVVVEDHADLLVPVGIVTDRDVLRGQVSRRADLSTLTVQDVMSPDPLTLSETSGLAEGISQLRARGVRRAPVVCGTGDLVGIVSVDDLLPAVADELRVLVKLIDEQPRREA